MDATAIFGNGAWINTDHGVLDATTGKAAPFGSDVKWDGDFSTASVVYVNDLEGGVIRVQAVNDNSTTPGTVNYTFQQWDTTTNKALSSPVTSTGIQGGDVFFWDDWEVVLPTLFTVQRDTNNTKTQLTAYSLQDFTQAWQQTLPATCSLQIQALGATSYAITDWGATDCTTSLPDQIIVNAQTGTQVWTDPSCSQVSSDPTQQNYCPIDGGQRVVYVETNGTLYGYDGTSATFAQLWSLPLPSSDDATVDSMGGHIFAFSMDSGQIWLLTE